MKPISGLFQIIIFFLITFVAKQSWASSPVDITIDLSGMLLKGKFYVSEGTGTFPTVVLLHGFPGNEIDVLGLGSKFSEAGISALTFNYSGTQQSEGEWSFENTQNDIGAALDFVRQQENINKYKIDTTRIYLGGYSFGGGMALTYAANHPQVNSVFSIAGTDHGEFMREYFRNKEFKTIMDEMFEQLKAPTGPVRFAEGTMPKEATRQVFAVADSAIDLRRSARLLAPKNILLIGGWDDPNVTIDDHILPLYRALQNEKAGKVKIVAIQDNHAFRNHREELARAIIEWLKAVSD